MRRLLVSAVLSLCATACVQPPCEVAEEAEVYINSSDDLEATSGCTELSGNLTIQAMAPTGLSGLENLTSVGGTLQIYGTYELTSLSGLENLTSVGGSLGIIGNDALTSLSGLDKLENVGGELAVWGNDVLPQCEADALAAQVGLPCDSDDCYDNNGTGTCN